jgi:AraC-like DNA-binding protein
MPDALVLQSSNPTPLDATLYEPVVCLILQGAKEVLLGDTIFHLGPGDVLVVSHDVPVNSRITTARPGEPYLAVILSLDVSLLRSLYDEAGRAVGDAGAEQSGTPALASTTADPRLVDAIARYLALAEDEVEARVLASAIRREIHFRLLMARNGGTLRSLLRHDSHASMVRMAIARIRAAYRGPIAVPELAREVGMSPSSLHKHFRSITSTTPLQFQKDLRLLEARRLLIAGQHAVSDVAYEVGYESPNQFSREYSRKYGVPPSSDLRASVASE